MVPPHFGDYKVKSTQLSCMIRFGGLVSKDQMLQKDFALNWLKEVGYWSVEKVDERFVMSCDSWRAEHSPPSNAFGSLTLRNTSGASVNLLISEWCSRQQALRSLQAVPRRAETKARLNENIK